MKITLLFSLLIAVCTISPPKKNIYSFKLNNIDGKEVNLADYKGKVLVVVNTASKCGFTPQYEEIEKFYKEYQSKGIIVLGFPANDFMRQEPGTNSEIKTFCSSKYNVTFPMFSKITVKGKDIHPLFTTLTTQPGLEGDVSWNFNKFLVDSEGKLIARYGSRTKPQDQELIAQLEKLLPHR